MLKKIKFFAFGILIFWLFIMACSKNQSQTDGKVTITFWHSFVSSTLPALTELIEKFESEYPDIHVKAQYVPTGDALVQKLITSIQSKTAPDISWIHSDFLDKLVQGQAIYPMDYFINSADGLDSTELADFYPALLRSASWQDTLYALPMEATSLAMLYNKDLFRKAGLDPEHPPQNWDELREFSRKLTVDRNNDGKFEQFGFYIPVFPASGQLSIWMVLQWSPFLWQAGGKIIDENQTKVLFNSQAGVQALSLWKNIYDDLQLQTFSLAHDMAFSSQILAMVLDGPWNLPRYRRIQNFDWAVAPLPAGPKQRATYLAGEHLAIFRQSQHPSKAWTFVKWIIQPENQAFFSEKSGYLPVRKSVLDMPEYQAFLKTDPALKGFADQMANAQGRETIDYFRVEINQSIAEAVEKSIRGNIDPKIALDESAEKANRFLKNHSKFPE